MNDRMLQILGNDMRRYPYALELQYPRILEKIIALWYKPSMGAYFADLLIDDRGTRQGFPKEVARDIHFLSNFFFKNNTREQHNPWGHAPVVIKQEILRNHFPYSPRGFFRASEKGNARVVGLFLTADMPVDMCDERKWTALMFAAMSGREEVIVTLLKNHASVNLQNNMGYAALHWAAFNGHTKTAQLLLSNGADPNAKSVHGWTPLFQAVARGHLSTSAVLLSRGADVNLVSNEGWSPLHKAAASGNLPEVILLLGKGANPQAKNTDNMTPYDLAAKNHHDEVVQKLSVYI